MGFFSRLHKLFDKEDKLPQQPEQPQQANADAPKPEPKSYSAQSYYLETDNIPFTPSRSQIIYIEDTYDIEVNNFIKENEATISSYFKSKGYEFCYIPSLLGRLSDRSVVEYYAPYAQELAQLSIDSSFPLRSMIARQREAIKPSLLYYSPNFNTDNHENRPRFKYVNIDLPQLSNDFSELLRYIIDDTSCAKPSSEVRYSLCDISFASYESCESASSRAKRSLGRQMRAMPEVWDEPMDWDSFDKETRDIISEIDGLVNRLSQKGLSEHILMQLITRPRVVSRMVITRDYRILLPDYNNMEITMTPLVKAVYFLFLRHPEGIVYKQLGDYRNELQHIYECIKGKPATSDMLESIHDATNPLKNSINEKVARIREAFVTRFDERLATNYIVHGGRGEAKCIPLKCEFVEWQ